MKTLHYRRHSKKAGELIGPEGLALAFAQGTQAWNQNWGYVFHGPLVRTAQTALAFVSGAMSHRDAWRDMDATDDLKRGAPNVMPIVDDIGDMTWINELATSEWRQLVAKGGLTNFDITKTVHPIEKVVEWEQRARRAVRTMLDQMVDGTMAIAFGHSPFIELAASSHGILPKELNGIAELDGIVFVEGDLTNEDTSPMSFRAVARINCAHAGMDIQKLAGEDVRVLA